MGAGGVAEAQEYYAPDACRRHFLRYAFMLDAVGMAGRLSP